MTRLFKMFITFVMAFSMLSAVPANTTVTNTDVKAEMAIQQDSSEDALFAMEDGKKKKKKKKKKKWKWGKKKKKGSGN
ncbi:MAG: hypothetical protein ISR83_07735 [Candidatus Marinimicrobia bacterium]|nr:hypothetical protein [Candidatus Neomarinimicrobiota bacterium]